MCIQRSEVSMGGCHVVNIIDSENHQNITMGAFSVQVCRKRRRSSSIAFSVPASFPAIYKSSSCNSTHNLCLRGTLAHFSGLGSSRIPSISSRRRASSSAQVCMLSFVSKTVLYRARAGSNWAAERTHEVSGLNAYAIAATTKLP